MPKIIPINWAIIRHPLNWLNIILMLMIAAFVFELFFISNPSCGCTAKDNS